MTNAEGLKSTYRLGALAALVNASAYLLAAAVYALYVYDLVGPSEPVYLPSETDDQQWLKYFLFIRQEAPYDNAQAMLACLGFAMLIPIGAVLRIRLASAPGPGTLAAATLVSGGVVLTTGELMHVGVGRR